MSFLLLLKKFQLDHINLDFGIKFLSLILLLGTTGCLAPENKEDDTFYSTIYLVDETSNERIREIENGETIQLQKGDSIFVHTENIYHETVRKDFRTLYFIS